VIDVDTDYLDTVEAQLVELPERGAHRRLRARAGGLGGAGDGRGPRLRTGALAFGAALAVVVAVVVVALGALHGGGRGGSAAARTRRHGHSAPATPRAKHGSGTRTRTATSPAAASDRGPSSGPVPPGFDPTSFTAISDLTWWLLGTAPCSDPPCTSIVRTTDGGQSFVGIHAPRAPLAPAANQAGVTQLRFADADDGFAYGASLYATHDGGVSWRAVGIGGSVTELAIADGTVYAVVVAPGGGPGRLMSSPVGEDRWRTLAAAGEVSGGLWANGSDVLVESAGGGPHGAGPQGGGPQGAGQLLISHDAGTGFARYPVPASLGCQFEEPTPAVVWALCATGMMSGVWRSTEYGAAFRSASGGAPGGGPGEQANSAAFAAASANTAVVGSQQLYRTADGGESYVPVGPAGVTWWQYLGFTDATHGVALGYAGSEIPSHERLYYTTDGGLSYHLVTIREQLGLVLGGRTAKRREHVPLERRVERRGALHRVPGAGDDPVPPAGLPGDGGGHGIERWRMAARYHERGDPRLPDALPRHLGGPGWPTVAQKPRGFTQLCRAPVQIGHSYPQQLAVADQELGAIARCLQPPVGDRSDRRGDLRIVHRGGDRGRLDQSQRADGLGSAGRREQGADRPVGVRDEVRRLRQQLTEIAGVELEILAVGGRTGSEAAPLDDAHAPAL